MIGRNIKKLRKGEREMIKPRLKRHERVSIDLDSNNQFQMLKKYYNLKELGDVHIYKSRAGYHLLLDLPHRTSKENIYIRHLIGDCPMRLELDEQRLRYGFDDFIDTLFRWKRNKGITGIEEEYNMFGIPWFNPIRAKVYIK